MDDTFKTQQLIARIGETEPRLEDQRHHSKGFYGMKPRRPFI